MRRCRRLSESNDDLHRLSGFVVEQRSRPGDTLGTNQFNSSVEVVAVEFALRYITLSAPSSTGGGLCVDWIDERQWINHEPTSPVRAIEDSDLSEFWPIKFYCFLAVFARVTV